ncbi:MAG: hypothetical protein NTX54_10550 [Chloroflexi bacterium]|nr:hypothetical protein [Chloroflexota bacterium]
MPSTSRDTDAPWNVFIARKVVHEAKPWVFKSDPVFHPLAVTHLFGFGFGSGIGHGLRWRLMGIAGGDVRNTHHLSHWRAGHASVIDERG